MCQDHRLFYANGKNEVRRNWAGDEHHQRGRSDEDIDGGLIKVGEV